jgi:2-polyprenyl-6-methoxyphenol hydroxylase-like FAD-dependent oxidoreductase
MLLARKGYKVLLVDKATFPSDTMSTHMVWLSGAVRLRRWGLLQRVIDSNCPPVTSGTTYLGSLTLTGSSPPLDGHNASYCVRRTKLDTILLAAAAEAGAEVREGFLVDEIARDDERVVGIRGHADGSAQVTERAHVVIGADGMRSLVARSIKPATYNVKPTLSCVYYSYWSGVPMTRGELHALDRRAIIVAPTNDDLIMIYIAWPRSEFHQIRGDIEGAFLRTVDLAPQFAERLRQGKREARFVGTGDLPNFFRKPYGPGWALVGDAGYHLDPSTGQGITDAFRDAELLTEALDASFSGPQPLDEALGDYERQRNEASLPMYEFTCQGAALNPPTPEELALFEALAGNQDQIDRYFGILTGAVSIPEFFDPDNIGRILASSANGQIL